jgi:hypothetical protein
MKYEIETALGLFACIWAIFTGTVLFGAFIQFYQEHQKIQFQEYHAKQMEEAVEWALLPENLPK